MMLLNFSTLYVLIPTNFGLATKTHTPTCSLGKLRVENELDDGARTPTSTYSHALSEHEYGGLRLRSPLILFADGL